MVVITFVHLDLGIGGAERLIVDAAMALKKKQHVVSVVTTHHDRSHCFPETTDGTIPVTVVGDWLPRFVFGKFGALCSYIRMLYAALYVILFSGLKTDIGICDQVSICVPVLQLGISKVVYYCHFPDQLLSKPGSAVKQFYRRPLNYAEERTTGKADIVLVNSEFTKSIFRRTFRGITRVPEVLYPSINDQQLAEVYENCDSELAYLHLEKYPYFLSINRYERKKNIGLAIASFSALQRKLSEEKRATLKLIIAGGYDTQVLENIEYLEELKIGAADLKVDDKLMFLKSPSEREKIKLMKNCKAVIYTPDNEHFGIVPLEAMYCRKPVIAVNSGGPKETVIHGETGYLCSPNKISFSAAMFEILNNENLCYKMGESARERFEKNFSFDAFMEKLNSVVTGHR